jgi:c-di-GMP-binding flagellar brake protein YcgR
MKKQRREDRPSVVASVKIKLVDGGPLMDAAAIDISRGGMGVYIKRPLEEGSKVVATLLFFDGKGYKTTEGMPGTVRWILEFGGQQATGMTRMAGIQFDSLINERQQPVLHACLEYAKRHA